VADDRAQRPARVALEPQPGEEAEAEIGAEVEVLFREARRRRRRIRASVGLAAVVAVAAGALIAATAPVSPGAHSLGSTDRTRNAQETTGRQPRATSVVWVDYTGRLRIGDLSRGTERALAVVDASPLAPVVVARGRAYVVDTAGEFVASVGHWSEVVDSVDLSTGSARLVAPGDGVFPSADGRRLFVPQAGGSKVIALSVRRPAERSVLTLPKGWYLPGGFGLAVGPDIVVQTNQSGTVTASDAVGLWNPAGGPVAVLARTSSDYTAASPDLGIVGASTGSAGSGRLVWMRPGCGPTRACPLEVTDVPSLSTRAIRSPLPYGFAPGGAVSSGGRAAVAFPLRVSGRGGGTADVAVVDLGTGAVHVVPGARVALGQVAAWAIWLPGRDAALAGTTGTTFLVHAATRSAQHLVFRADRKAQPGPDFSSAPAGR
jgi:hypothetical protein